MDFMALGIVRKVKLTDLQETHDLKVALSRSETLLDLKVPVALFRKIIVYRNYCIA